MAHILLIEDCAEISKMVEALLSPSHQLDRAATLMQATRRLRSQPSIDLVLLDIDLPDGSGIDFFASFKEELEASGTRTIFLTGTNTAYARTRGYALGAIDYISKPFDPIEFQVRVNARLKHQEEAQRAKAQSHLRLGNLEIDLTRQAVFAEAEGQRRQLDLTPVEFRLLLLFAQKTRLTPEKAVTRAEILEKVWGGTAHVSARCVDHHICGLRKKVAPLGCLIKPVYGVGYTMAPFAQATACGPTRGTTASTP